MHYFIKKYITKNTKYRAVDCVQNYDKSDPVYRAEWSDHCPRLIAESFQAYGYVFLVLRLLGILRTDRTLGPLQVKFFDILF